MFFEGNKISFKLSTETFGCDKEPPDVVEIYIDGDKLCEKIPCGLPLWPSEIYTSLMRNCFLKDEPVYLYVVVAVLDVEIPRFILMKPIILLFGMILSTILNL